MMQIPTDPTTETRGVAAASGVMREAPDGFTLVNLYEAFTSRISPVFERYEADGQRVGAFYVEEAYLDPHSGALHDGMVMLVADLFLGRVAWTTAKSTCVTLNMRAAHIADVPVGALVEVRARLDGRTSSIVFVSGDFTWDGQTVMKITSGWKVLHAT
ncbi:MAG: PaaI family thioesterase [Janthinobacterium lividum]